MRLDISLWMRLTGLFLTFLSMPMVALHAETPTDKSKPAHRSTAVPFSKRVVVEWNTLSFEELQAWFTDDRQQNTILSVPEGSTVSMKIEIENDLFAFTSASLSEPPVLRLRAKKDIFLTKRGSTYWIKCADSSWTNLDKAFKSTIENQLSTSQVEQDEYGPLVHIRITSPAN